MLGLLPVGVRTIESSSDVVHLIDTHCVAFKNGTAIKKKKERFHVGLVFKERTDTVTSMRM